MIKEKELDSLVERYPALAAVRNSVEEATRMIIHCYTKGGKVLVCGNGGSSSDADHFVGELMKGFESGRPLDESLKKRLCEISAKRGKVLAGSLEHGLPAISLSAHCSLTTAILNDLGASLVFAQQIIGYGMDNDVLIGISTSGNSENVINACITAKALNLNVIGLTGKTGGKMKQYCDVLINVPEKRTAFVQDLHLPILHAVCSMVENQFYGN